MSPVSNAADASLTAGERPSRQGTRGDPPSASSSTQGVSLTPFAPHQTMANGVQANEVLVPTPVQATWNQFKDNLRSFLNAEADTGMLFAQIALDTGDAARAALNRHRARLAYDAGMRHFRDVPLSNNDREKISAKLALLKNALEELGEAV